MQHPTNTVKNAKGEEEPEILKYCAYHQPTCVGEHDDDDHAPECKTPNSYALCSECIMQGGKPIPIVITPRSAPGVAPVSIETKLKKLALQSGEGGENEDGEGGTEPKDAIDLSCITEKTRCFWKPGNGNMRGYVCKNYVYMNPETKALMATCPWHVKLCIRSHPEGGGTVAYYAHLRP